MKRLVTLVMFFAMVGLVSCAEENLEEMKSPEIENATSDEGQNLPCKSDCD